MNMAQGFFRKLSISTGSGRFYTYNTKVTIFTVGHVLQAKQQAQAAESH